MLAEQKTIVYFAACSQHPIVRENRVSRQREQRVPDFNHNRDLGKRSPGTVGTLDRVNWHSLLTKLCTVREIDQPQHRTHQDHREEWNWNSQHVSDNLCLDLGRKGWSLKLRERDKQWASVESTLQRFQQSSIRWWQLHGPSGRLGKWWFQPDLQIKQSQAKCSYKVVTVPC